MLSVGGHSCCVQLWAMCSFPLGMGLGIEFLVDRVLAFIESTTECACVVFSLLQKVRVVITSCSPKHYAFFRLLAILGMYSVALFRSEISFS